MSITIFIGSDHAGFQLKQTIVEYLLEKTHQNVIDVGCNAEKRCDYPEFAKSVAEKVSSSENTTGILVCGTGQGMAMTANKYPNIRAGVANTMEVAHLIREHNNANVLCLGARLLDWEKARSIVDEFLKTPFSDEKRHHIRVEKIPK